MLDEKTQITKYIGKDEAFEVYVGKGEKRRSFKLEKISKNEADRRREKQVGDKMTLHPLWPNPYPISSAENVVSRFYLPQHAVASLHVYNILGQEVWSSRKALYQPGYHAVIWNATNNNQHRVASGVYFVILKSGGRTAKQKLIIID